MQERRRMGSTFCMLCSRYGGLSLVMSMMVSFYAVLFPRRCLGLNLGFN